MKILDKIFLSLMKISSLMIGNSSSGILECPSFCHSINIGSRQEEEFIQNQLLIYQQIFPVR